MHANQTFYQRTQPPVWHSGIETYINKIESGTTQSSVILEMPWGEILVVSFLCQHMKFLGILLHGSYLVIQIISLCQLTVQGIAVCCTLKMGSSDLKFAQQKKQITK